MSLTCCVCGLVPLQSLTPGLVSTNKTTGPGSSLYRTTTSTKSMASPAFNVLALMVLSLSQTESYLERSGP